MKILNVNELREAINETKGKFFSVEFTKKDGSYRKMLCRTGVKKHLKGGELPYDPIEKMLLPVYDVQKQAYRTIPLNRVHAIKLANQTN